MATLPSTNHKCDIQKYPFPHCTLSKHPSKKTSEHYSRSSSAHKLQVMLQKSHNLPIWTGSINLEPCLATLPTWLSCQITWSLENVLPATTWAWLLYQIISGFLLFQVFLDCSFPFPESLRKWKKAKKFYGRAQNDETTFRGSTLILVLTMIIAWWWHHEVSAHIPSSNLRRFRKFIWVVLLEFLADISLLQVYTSQWLQKRSGYVAESWVNCSSPLFGENKCVTCP